MGTVLSIFWLLSSCASGTPLNEYQPQNQSEVDELRLQSRSWPLQADRL